ncbi:MAG TPA: uroporphyrinogen-III C-methyltransferase [Lacipirellulaceae bacterium]|nr:uroporphyrinogen-III C-methyltransferase [Lacipirellulaceae bacterium]
MTIQRGIAYLIGAGPGDPGLLTLRGAECLNLADVVMYDYLASPELLSHTRPDAELICLGRHGHGRLMSQTEICGLMVRHASEGRSVARLKGGDPAIFARLAEEISALDAAHVSYEIVPGVTAASAASSYAGIPLTDRDEASCVAFITGQEHDQKSAADALDYGSIAKFPGTLVFYMGITTAPNWCGSLIAHGKSPKTPVAIVRRASLSDQQGIATTLGDLPRVLLQTKLRPPAVVIVGDVARDYRDTNWFNARPLFGKTVLVTRPEHQADALARQLQNLGANVLYQPAIEIAPPGNWAKVDAVIERLREFDWLVFSSSNGVHFFMQRLLARGYDARRLAGARLAGIGPATAEALADFHLVADVQPDEYRAEALAEALGPQANGKRILLLRASRGREVLNEMLTASGANVEQVVVYDSCDVATANEEVATALAASKIDFTTVTSSAIARNLISLFGDSLRKTKLAAISPLTADVLSSAGFPAAVIAKTFTSEGIVEAILEYPGRRTS